MPRWNIKTLVENGFNSVMGISFLLGLFCPGLDRLPDVLVLWIVSLVMLFSFSRISIAEMKQIRLKEALGFYGLRFLILPVVLFAVSQLIVPQYSYAVLLLALVPAGVSAGALCMVMGGNVALGVGVTIVSSLIAPVAVPLFFSIAGKDLALDVWGIFQTLSLMIFLPAAIYFGAARKVPAVKSWIKDWSRFYTILLLGAMFLVTIASQRDRFFENPVLVVECLLVLLPLFFIFYVFGWFLFPKTDLPHKIAYALSSGAINNAIAIGLAFLYFSQDVIFCLVLSEIPWMLGVAGIQAWINRAEKKKSEEDFPC